MPKARPGRITGNRHRTTFPIVLPERKPHWSDIEIALLVRLATARATTKQIAFELKRSEQAIRLKASRMGLSLTAHEVRRSARRHLKRQGGVMLAEAKSLRARPAIKATIDFDLSSLSRQERLQLIERLLQLERDELGDDSGESSRITRPGLCIECGRRALRVPKRYDASADRSAHNRRANTAHVESRERLGWTGRPEDHPAYDGDDLAALYRLMREDRAQQREEARARAKEGDPGSKNR